jgi:hypothetical protein
VIDTHPWPSKLFGRLVCDWDIEVRHIPR